MQYIKNKKNSYKSLVSDDGKIEKRYYTIKKHYQVISTSIDSISEYFASCLGLPYLDVLKFFTKQIIDIGLEYDLKLHLFTGREEENIECYNEIHLEPLKKLEGFCSHAHGVKCVRMPKANDFQTINLSKKRKEKNVTISVCYSKAFSKNFKILEDGDYSELRVMRKNNDSSANQNRRSRVASRSRSTNRRARGTMDSNRNSGY